jgi:hypothetical protein
LKDARKKCQVNYKRKPIRIAAEFSTETLKVRKAWNEILRALKETNSQPGLVYPAKLFLIIEIKTKTFHNK